MFDELDFLPAKINCKKQMYAPKWAKNTKNAFLTVNCPYVGVNTVVCCNCVYY